MAKKKTEEVTKTEAVEETVAPEVVKSFDCTNCEDSGKSCYICN